MRKLLVLRNHSPNNQELAAITLHNHYQYCNKHRYDFIDYNENYPDCGWTLLEEIRNHLTRYEFVVCIGDDLIFTNPDKPITDLLFPEPEALTVGAEDIARGGSEINLDIQVWHSIRNTDSLIDFLNESKSHYLSHKWITQGALGDLIKSQNPLYHRIDVVPVRRLQSAAYKNCPMMWEPGDFVLHYLGGSMAWKVAGCRKFLSTGEVLWAE